MKRRDYLWLIILLVVLLSVPLLSYGTLSPCGMLRQEIKRLWIGEMLKDVGSRSGLGAFGGLLGLGLGNVFLDPMVDAMSPIQCIRGFVNLKRQGKKFLATIPGLETGAFQGPPVTTSLSPTPPPAPKDPPTWIVRTKTSPIDDSKNVYISLEANGSVGDGFSKTTPELLLRCKENKTEAYIRTGMAARYESGNSGAATVLLRFDKEKAMEENFTRSTDDKALFFPDPIHFITKMLENKKMLFQFTPAASSLATTTFNLSGLGEELGDLRRACHW